MDERVRILIAERLDLDAEFVAVIEGDVALRDAGGPEVVVMAVGEGAGLSVSADLGFRGAAAHRVDASARPGASLE